jgi:hypothetical protein
VPFFASKANHEKAFLSRALAALRNSGPLGRGIAEYVEAKRVPLGFSRQSTSGATWLAWRALRLGIFLNARYVARLPEDPRVFALVAHEARHRQQGFLEALSVRGELDAWQLHYDVLDQAGAAPKNAAWLELRQLAPSVRDDLRRARDLIKAIGGKSYHIEWMPLTPVPEEVRHWLGTAIGRLCKLLHPR